MEIEAKFRLADPRDASIDPFKRVIKEHGFRVDCPDEPFQIVDTYFDTEKHDLHAGGAALRLRVKGERILLTYKRKVAQEGALHSRVELEAEPEPKHLKAVFFELGNLGFSITEESMLEGSQEQIDELLGSWGLIPVVEIITIRLSCQVSEGQDPVASFVLDHVDFERRSRRGGYVGIEIEAMGEGNAANVMKISDALKSSLGERIQEQKLSKYEFALGSLA
jgi:inorganic triphosphatase YgiF